MASCTYSVPDLNGSGDKLYGPVACNQAFIDWAWDAHDFDKDDWDEGFGWDQPCDITQPLARTFNALWCLNYSAADYSNQSYSSDILHWGGRYVRENIDELDARCGDGSAIATTRHGPIIDNWTRLFLGFFYERVVSERAGTLVHEARHADGKSHDKGSKDSSWGYNGAWRYHVCWLSWFAYAGTRTSVAMRTAARQRANIILDTNFVQDPGFNL